MSSARHRLELLAPAKNAEFGCEAINHGADAVYIGGPSFGARAAAGNDLADIVRLADYAHRYSAQVFVTLNTILKDDELEAARRIAWQVYEAGADALIIQDMGLLELDLPPIALHASTQADNRSAAKAHFLEQAGFSRVVLARELSLTQIREIAAATTAELEFFVHGALCVSYSGQCYVSHAQTGRSANRGECSQMCRLPFTVADSAGEIVVRDRHVLSPKDNNQSANLRALAEAGISSFKIEGRLKDLSYVKNITAHYRTLLDEILAEVPHYRAASAGRCTFFFQPQPEKSFNRGFTDYFAQERHQDLLALDSPKFVGAPIGTASRVGPDWFEVETDAALHNGDGLSWYDAAGQLAGVRINRAEGRRLFPAEKNVLPAVGTTLYRNRDQEFERLLEKKSAERRIRVQIHLAETAAGFALTLTDEEGISATVELAQPHEPAQNAERAAATLHEQLGKLGNTIFMAEDITLALSTPWFIPVGALNALRREGVEQLEAARHAAYRRPARAAAAVQPPIYPQSELSYLGNVYNQRARDFYTRHGVSLIAEAYEANRERGEVSLMITKHCVRYSFNLCPKQVKGIKPDPMTLISAGENLRLEFDCKRCEMHVMGRLKPQKVALGSLKRG
ncbi:MAG: U32 family peptidase [Gammaproteobacteria bacterium]|jgi:putative protease|nr:U32 family peptidase [Gammaproteobacteria bacterium]